MDEEIITIIQGPKGENGKDGRDGLNGKDGAKGLDGKDGEQGMRGLKGANGLDGKDGSPDTGDMIIDKIHSSSKKIQAKNIDGFEDRMNENNRKIQKVLSFGGANSINIKNNGSVVGQVQTINLIGTTITPVGNGGEINVTVNGGSSAIPELTSDPLSPTAQSAWVLKTGGLVSGKMQTSVGPYSLLLGKSSTPVTYQFSYRTLESTTIRTTLA